MSKGIPRAKLFNNKGPLSPIHELSIVPSFDIPHKKSKKKQSKLLKFKNFIRQHVLTSHILSVTLYKTIKNILLFFFILTIITLVHIPENKFDSKILNWVLYYSTDFISLLLLVLVSVLGLYRIYRGISNTNFQIQKQMMTTINELLKTKYIFLTNTLLHQYYHKVIDSILDISPLDEYSSLTKINNIVCCAFSSLCFLFKVTSFSQILLEVFLFLGLMAVKIFEEFSVIFEEKMIQKIIDADYELKQQLKDLKVSSPIQKLEDPLPSLIVHFNKKISQIFELKNKNIFMKRIIFLRILRSILWSLIAVTVFEQVKTNKNTRILPLYFISFILQNFIFGRTPVRQGGSQTSERMIKILKDLKEISQKAPSVANVSRVLDIYDSPNSDIVSTENTSFGEFRLDYVEQYLKDALGLKKMMKPIVRNSIILSKIPLRNGLKQRLQNPPKISYRTLLENRDQNSSQQPSPHKISRLSQKSIHFQTFGEQEISKKSIKTFFMGSGAPSKQSIKIPQRTKKTAVTKKMISCLKNVEKHMQDLAVDNGKDIQASYFDRDIKVYSTVNFGLTFQIKKNNKICLIGTNQAGISGFYRGLLGQLDAVQSHEMISVGRIGYLNLDTCPIYEGVSIKNNILDGSPFQEDKYISLLMILKFSIFNGLSEPEVQVSEGVSNLTQVESNILLLARFLYQDYELYIFDGVFSTVKSNFEMELFKVAVVGLLGDKAVVYDTQSSSAMRASSSIWYFQEGRIQWKGTFEQISKDSDEILHSLLDNRVSKQNFKVRKVNKQRFKSRIHAMSSLSNLGDLDIQDNIESRIFQNLEYCGLKDIHKTNPGPQDEFEVSNLLKKDLLLESGTVGLLLLSIFITITAQTMAWGWIVLLILSLKTLNFVTYYYIIFLVPLVCGGLFSLRDIIQDRLTTKIDSYLNKQTVVNLLEENYHKWQKGIYLEKVISCSKAPRNIQKSLLLFDSIISFAISSIGGSTCLTLLSNNVTHLAILPIYLAWILVMIHCSKKYLTRSQSVYYKRKILDMEMRLFIDKARDLWLYNFNKQIQGSCISTLKKWEIQHSKIQKIYQNTTIRIFIFSIICMVATLLFNIVNFGEMELNPGHSNVVSVIGINLLLSYYQLEIMRSLLEMPFFKIYKYNSQDWIPCFGQNQNKNLKMIQEREQKKIAKEQKKIKSRDLVNSDMSRNDNILRMLKDTGKLKVIMMDGCPCCSDNAHSDGVEVKSKCSSDCLSSMTFRRLFDITLKQKIEQQRVPLEIQNLEYTIRGHNIFKEIDLMVKNGQTVGLVSESKESRLLLMALLSGRYAYPTTTNCIECIPCQLRRDMVDQKDLEGILTIQCERQSFIRVDGKDADSIQPTQLHKHVQFLLNEGGDTKRGKLPEVSIGEYLNPTNDPRIFAKAIALFSLFRLPEILDHLLSSVEVNSSNQFSMLEQQFYSQLKNKVACYLRSRFLIGYNPNFSKFEDSKIETEKVLDPRTSHSHTPFFIALTELYTRTVILKDRRLSYTVPNRNEEQFEKEKESNQDQLAKKLNILKSQTARRKKEHIFRFSRQMSHDSSIDSYKEYDSEQVALLGQKANQLEKEIIKFMLKYKIRRWGSNIPTPLRKVIDLIKVILDPPMLLVIEDSALVTTTSNSAYNLSLLRSQLPKMGILLGVNSLRILEHLEDLVVLKKGSIIQQGEPKHLLEETKGELKRLVSEETGLFEYLSRKLNKEETASHLDNIMDHLSPTNNTQNRKNSESKIFQKEPTYINLIKDPIIDKNCQKNILDITERRKKMNVSGKVEIKKLNQPEVDLESIPEMEANSIDQEVDIDNNQLSNSKNNCEFEGENKMEYGLVKKLDDDQKL